MSKLNEELIWEKIEEAMAGQTKPIILTVDGPDGCGKATVTKIIREMLSQAGVHVTHLEPPFYNTLTGKIISEYLKSTQASEITDRRIISEMYGFDRNMYYAFNWDRITDTKVPAVILYNRSWLSNLIYQTTLIGATPSDPYKQVNEYYQIFDQTGTVVWSGTLANLRNIIEALNEQRGESDPVLIAHSVSPSPTGSANGLFSENGKLRSNVYDQMVSIYTAARHANIYEMMDFIYENEISCWRVRGASVPFTETLPVYNFVICPSFDDAGISILMGNMQKRYNGDDSKNDRNENKSFLEAVVENIYWINKNRSTVFDSHMYMGYKKINANYTIPVLEQLTLRMEQLKRAFDYQIINTSKCVSQDYRHFDPLTTTVQVPPEMVACNILDSWLSQLAGNNSTVKKNIYSE